MSNQTDTQPVPAPTLTLTAAFEGIEGSYSHVVLDAYAGRRGVTFAPLGCQTYRAVAHAVLSGRADVGLLPVDNAIAGTIREGYDVLAEYELDPLAEITCGMEHRLVGVARRDAGGRARDRFARGRPGRVRPVSGDAARRARVPVGDTAIAARDVAAAKPIRRTPRSPQSDAGRRYGLVELANTIADHPDNYTRFLLFRAPNARGVAAEFEPAARLQGRSQDLAGVRGRRQAGRAGPLARRCSARTASTSRNSTRSRAWARASVRVLRRRRRRYPRGALRRRAAGAAKSHGQPARHRQLRCRHRRRRACASRRRHGRQRAASRAGAGKEQNLEGHPARPGHDRARPRRQRRHRRRHFVVAGGPCSVESREQILADAHEIGDHGAPSCCAAASSSRAPRRTRSKAWAGKAWRCWPKPAARSACRSSAK
jgi:prephenate dehydratase